MIPPIPIARIKHSLLVALLILLAIPLLFLIAGTA